jgi:alkylation response protein AidB-like acyl-CoA dehydrogenase
VITLLDSDVAGDLRTTVRKVLADRAPWQSVLARMDTSDPYDVPLWRTLASGIGCAALPTLPEAGWREAAVVAEELGRAAAPIPHLGGAMTTAALMSAPDPGLLDRVTTGTVIAAFTLPLSTPLARPASRSWSGDADAAPQPRSAGRQAAETPAAEVSAPGGRLSGTVTSVVDALVADVLVVPTADGLWEVPASAATVTPVVSLDQTRPLADVRFDDAPARRLAAGEEATRAVAAALTAGCVVLAAEQLGVAEWCLETTVAYVKERHQFGRPVGSFQAVKHRLAQLWVQVTQARAVARYAAGCLATADPDTTVAAHLAQAHCGPLAVRAAEECVQLHGGIGFTWEHPAHLYLKRAKADAIALGTAAHHRDALARLQGLTAD